MRPILALAALLLATAALAQPTQDAATALRRAADLDRSARAARDEGARARLAAAALAARVQAAEAAAASAEGRLAALRAQALDRRRRLAAREQPLAALVAGLHGFASRPIAAALFQPGSIRDAVRVRAVLDTVAAQIGRETRALRAELAHTRALEAEAAGAAVAFDRARRALQAQQQRLEQSQAVQRRRSAQFDALARAEQERAALLVGSRRSLRALTASIAAESRRQSGADLPETIGGYRLPVLGRLARSYGMRLPSGARASGVTVAARPDALVVAPAAGRVAFAGLYRGYGAIAILDHGGGFVTLLTGLSANLARAGDTVAGGGPIGRAGPGGVTVELRRDGRAVDPTPFIG